MCETLKNSSTCKPMWTVINPLRNLAVSSTKTLCKCLIFKNVCPGVLIVLSPTRLKKQLKVCNFSSDAEVIVAAKTWLD